MAIQELLAARDFFGIERAMGAIFYTRGGFADMDEYRKVSIVLIILSYQDTVILNLSS